MKRRRIIGTVYELPGLPGRWLVVASTRMFDREYLATHYDGPMLTGGKGMLEAWDAGYPTLVLSGNVQGVYVKRKALEENGTTNLQLA